MVRRPAAQRRSGPGQLHARHQHRARGAAALVVGIGTHGDDVAQHLPQVAGDRHLVHGVHDAAALDPEAGGAARVVAGDLRIA